MISKKEMIYIVMIALIMGILFGILINNYFVNYGRKNESNALNLLGLKYLNEGNNDYALFYFSQSIYCNPNWYEPYIGLARVYQKENKCKLSIDLYEKAYKLNPKDSNYDRYNQKVIEDNINLLKKNCF